MDNLLLAFGSAREVLRASVLDLKRVRGISAAAATAISERTSEEGEKILDRVAKFEGSVLCPEDELFPPRLKTIPDRPVLLFALGKLDLLDADAVAMVGSRNHTRYGGEVTRTLAHGAAKAGLVIVSGMARGIDAIAHSAALDAGGKTVGVLGNGFGVVYPSANRALYERMAKEGCLVTEYPPGERPNAGSFPRRNRLISGLAKATVVVEASERSGALITADCALNQGREVLAVPGPITNPVCTGTNRLVQMGAKPVLGVGDVLEEYGLDERYEVQNFPSDVTAEERHVLDLLASGVDQLERLVEQFGKDPGDCLAVITSLEIRGLVSVEADRVVRGSLAGL